MTKEILVERRSDPYELQSRLQRLEMRLLEQGTDAKHRAARLDDIADKVEAMYDRMNRPIEWAKVVGTTILILSFLGGVVMTTLSPIQERLAMFHTRIEKIEDTLEAQSE